MTIYMIVNQGDEVSVTEYQQPTKPEALKYQAETVWKYESDAIFWTWFKKTIAYDNEALTLLVITDKATWQPDKSICIAKRSIIDPAIEDDLVIRKGKANLFTFPDLKLKKNSVSRKRIRPSPPKKERHHALKQETEQQAEIPSVQAKPPQVSNLKSYFNKQTDEYRRG